MVCCHAAFRSQHTPARRQRTDKEKEKEKENGVDEGALTLFGADALKTPSSSSSTALMNRSHSTNVLTSPSTTTKEAAKLHAELFKEVSRYPPPPPSLGIHSLVILHWGDITFFITSCPQTPT